jgi:F420-dependent oxidoreductase-like protein
MRLVTNVVPDTDVPTFARRLADLERVGLDGAFIGEAYGLDAPTTLGYLAAATDRMLLGTGALNVFSRSPALLAMTAAGLDAASGGRAVLGLGASGPQLVESFHGIPFDQPVARTRAAIELCRRAWRREPVTGGGPAPVPFERAGATTARPVKLAVHPLRRDIPVFIAGLGPANVALAAELADGWLSLFLVPELVHAVWGAALDVGINRRDPSLAPLTIVAGGPAAVVDDEERAIALRDTHRRTLAFYAGGMGGKAGNFYNDLFCRYGYKDEAAEILDRFQSGDRAGATAAVPDELVRRTSLIGSIDEVRDRVIAYRAAGVAWLALDLQDADGAATIEAVRALVDEA